MDNVDMRYKDSIREALQMQNISRLMELVPTLDEVRAKEVIEEWQSNYNQTMQMIRNNQDTTELDKQAVDMLYDLLDSAKLSGYHR